MLAPTTKLRENREFAVDSGASLHMLSNRDLSPDEMETLRRSRTPTVVVTANFEVQTNEEAQVDAHDRDFFVRVGQWSKATPKMGRNSYAKRKISYLLLFLDCRQVLVPARLLNRYRRTHQVLLRVQQQSEVTSRHRETGANHQNHKTKTQRRATSRQRETFQNGWSSQKISNSQKRPCPRTFLMTQIRNALRKWYKNQRSTELKLTSQKTEMQSWYKI